MLALIAEFGHFLLSRKRYWTIPPMIIFLLFGLLMIFAQGSALSPLIYTLF